MPAFEKAYRRHSGGAGALDKVPSLSRRKPAPPRQLVGKPTSEVAVPPERLAVAGDRGVPYSATPAGGLALVAGEWWPADSIAAAHLFDEGRRTAFGS